MAILVTGLAVASSVLAVYAVSVQTGDVPEHARSMAIVTLVSSLAVVLLALSRGSTRPAWIIAACAIVSAIALTQVQMLSALMHLHVLAPKDWLIGFAAGVVPALLARLIHWKAYASGTRPADGRQALVPDAQGR
jgi:hypothetical protein